MTNPQNQKLISASNISVEKNDNKILSNISIDISSAEFVTILGPNGAGKSMLLKSLMGMEAINSGTITRAQNLSIGYVPQRFTPDVTMPISVFRFLNLSNKFPKSLFDSVISKTAIAPILNKQLSVLSGGELQRVMLARALLKSPNLLILDEPAQNLDVSSQLAFYKLLDEIYAEQKIAILMVSHDLHFVMASSQKVVCLFHHICCTGTPQIVAQDPEFIKVFGADMSKLMAIYNHQHNHSHAHIHAEGEDHENCDHNH